MIARIICKYFGHKPDEHNAVRRWRADEHNAARHNLETIPLCQRCKEPVR